MSWDKPTDEQIDTVRTLTRHPQIYRRFFEQLENPRWLEPLKDLGYFSTPPDKVRFEGEDDRYWWPEWSESKFLARISAERPDEVARIMTALSSKTENPTVHVDFLNAATKMPVPNCTDLALAEAKWMRHQHALGWFLPESTVSLVQHLSTLSQCNAAIELCRALFELLPDPKSEEDRTVAPDFVMPPDPHPKIDSWHYKNSLTKVLPGLIGNCPDRAFRAFTSILHNGIKLLDRKRPDSVTAKRVHDASFVWRPAIEEHSQNSDFQILSPVVSVVRDLAEALMSSSGEQVLQELETQQYAVFHRIALHLRRQWTDVDWKSTQSLMCDLEVFHDVYMHHELFRLLEETFGKCETEYKARYFALVDAGPNYEEEDELSLAWWTYRKLIPISKYLDGKQRDRFVALSERLGPFPHPDFHVYSESWSGPTSPVSTEELSSQQLGQVIEFLRQWRSTGGEMNPSREGLGRKLLEVIQLRPGEFSTHAEEFKSLDPTYVRPLFSGLADVLSKGEPIEWKPVLALASWVLEQPQVTSSETRRGDADPGWGWTKKAIAYLVRVGLHASPNAIPSVMIHEVWAIIRVLIEDPEPTPEYEERYGGQNSDPVTLSINTVRGEAMHALFAYCRWLSQHEASEALRLGKEHGSWRLTPELRTVLEDHLDPRIDPSTTVRSVYGQNTELLLLLDREWTESNLASIFPLVPGREGLFEAAWFGYLFGARGLRQFAGLMLPYLLTAIDRLGENWTFRPLTIDPEEKLGEHVIHQFALGLSDLTSPVSAISRFYQRASLNVRRQALSYAGRGLKPVGAILPDDARNRLISLWDARLSHVRSNKQDSAEIEPFGWWLTSGAFDRRWSLEQAFECLKVAGNIEPDFLVLESIASWTSEFPELVCDCLELMLKGTQHGWSSVGWSEHTREILSELMKQSQPELRVKTERLIHDLGSRGYYQYRDLLRR
jgi:hypothetical protein